MTAAGAPPPEQIAAALAPRFGPGLEIGDLRRLSSGASRATFAFEALPAGGPPVPLILQAAYGSGLSMSVDVEGRLLERAAAAGVPVPEVLAVEAEPEGKSAGGGRAFLVTRRIEGEALPSRLFREDRFTKGVERLNDDAAAALAAIHCIDPDSVDLPEADPLGGGRATLDLLGEARPVLELTLRWLLRNKPEDARRTVVHGDFRLGNLLVGPGGLAAVLDWELAHVGDPLEDLAWPLVRAWRFDKVRPAGAFPDSDAWVAAYEAISDRVVDRPAFRWWEVAATFRWAVICLAQAHRHLDGWTPSLELAMVGRRVFECEWDLLGLLGVRDRGPTNRGASDREGGSQPDLDAALPGGDLHGSSTLEVILEAVKALLEGDLAALSDSVGDGSLRYQVRVAANALEVAGRELRLGPAQQAAHDARLRRLGLASDAELAEAIRRGQLESGEDLHDVLVADTEARLLVANPTWLQR